MMGSTPRISERLGKLLWLGSEFIYCNRIVVDMCMLSKKGVDTSLLGDWVKTVLIVIMGQVQNSMASCTLLTVLLETVLLLLRYSIRFQLKKALKLKHTIVLHLCLVHTNVGYMEMSL